jgi:hypothetical protein
MLVIRMKSPNKRKIVLGPWAIAIMLALLLAFLILVAPINAQPSANRPCSDRCDKVDISTATEDQCQTVKVRTWMENGVQKTLWASRCKAECTRTDTHRICYHQIRCANNRVCERIDPAYSDTVSKSKIQCHTGWGRWRYYITPIENSGNI